VERLVVHKRTRHRGKVQKKVKKEVRKEHSTGKPLKEGAGIHPEKVPKKKKKNMH